MPKTGSTFLLKKLCRYTGYSRKLLRSHPEIQEFDKLRIRKHYYHNLVDQIHSHGSIYAAEQLNNMNANVIILYRNLYDITISMVAFLNSDEYRNVVKKKGARSTFGGIINNKFYDLSKDEQYDHVINLDIPAFVHFYASWKNYEKYLDRPPFWISYEEFFSNIENNFSKVLSYCSLEVDPNKISVVIDSKDETRLNKGATRKRGGNILSSPQIERIEIIANTFPEYKDFLLGNI